MLKPATPRFGGVPLKWISLGLLIVQTTTLVLSIRWSSMGGGQDYLASVAVFYMEAVKYITCILVIAFQNGGSLSATMKVIRNECYGSLYELAKLAVPSVLYTVQNNLLYLAINNLDAPTYQVSYNCKILTTGVFSVVILGKHLGGVKWFALVLLTAGVSLTQVNPNAVADVAADASKWIGLISVGAAAITSGFAGVYFEAVLKGSSTTLWVRNVQMATTTVPLSLAMVMLKDYAKVQEVGMHHGMDWLVWSIIFNQAFGGLLIAVVVRYADNILKAFAAAISIVTSTIISAMFFGFVVTPYFVAGSVVVLGASFLYSNSEKYGNLLPMFRSQKQSPKN